VSGTPTSLSGCFPRLQPGLSPDKPEVFPSASRSSSRSPLRRQPHRVGGCSRQPLRGHRSARAPPFWRL